MAKKLEKKSSKKVKENVIYIVTYYTESCDHGAIGYWTEEPTEEQLTAIFRELMPQEFTDYWDEDEKDDPARTVFWEGHELGLQKLPEGVPYVPSI